MKVAMAKRFVSRWFALVLCGWVAEVGAQGGEPIDQRVSTVISLDGSEWRIVADPNNEGKKLEWGRQPPEGGKSIRVPWILQEALPDYHGVVWYWRRFRPPPLPDPRGRYLVRFWAVDYAAEVWVNGKLVGGHEGGEAPFVLDVTAATQPDADNLLVVRVLNPTEDPIDGITLKETPHRNKTSAFTYGCDYNHGGIEDSVELLATPPARVADLQVRADPASGTLRVTVETSCGLPSDVNGTLQIAVGPAGSGTTSLLRSLPLSVPSGTGSVSTEIQIAAPRRWELNDPFLYRVTVRLQVEGASAMDEMSVRTGFRDFRFADGAFRLNGRRLLLKSSVSGNMTPIGIHVALDPDWLRRDLFHSKTMGFNCIRFYGMPTRSQLHLCDELGLMVFEECFASQGYADSPKMTERFDRATAEMIRRDRNHPSVVMWGLLNETADGPQFRQAVTALDLVRSLDEDRVVVLSSGRFDLQLGIGSIANPGSRQWEHLLGGERPGASATKSSQFEGYFVPAYIQKVGDAHVYPWVPHTGKDIEFLRTVGRDTQPIFISEYGISSALDLRRLVRLYEQYGRGDSPEAKFHRQALAQFERDWSQWRLGEVFGRAEDFFLQCQARMSRERWGGINALRANPAIAGYNLTGTADQGFSGEGLVTSFRELKPGVVDAISDGLAPLRWCLFAEPGNVHRGQKVKLEAVLANEDVLAPGEYPARAELMGEDQRIVWSKRFTVRIGDPQGRPATPLAMSLWSEEIPASWPAGAYRLVATFDRGAAAAGGAAELRVYDSGGFPAVDAPVTLWSPDPEVSRWLTAHQISCRSPEDPPPANREVILVTTSLPSPAGKPGFRRLAERMARGAKVIFLDSSIFSLPGAPAGGVPLVRKGELVYLRNNVYHKEDWARPHPIFHGLPTGLMDYAVYRNVIPNRGWTGQQEPAEAVAGAIDAVTAYASGLHVAVHRFGAGAFVLNTLRIRENLDRDPVADRLLINMLRFAGHDRGLPAAEPPADLASRLKELGYE